MEKTRRTGHSLLLILSIGSVLLVGFFVWPTPYQYELIHQGNSVRTGRIERWNPSRVQFLSPYGCWVSIGNNDRPYECLSRERQNQIELKARAEAQAQRVLGSFSNEREVATYYGVLLGDQAGKRLKWSDIDRQISDDNDFDGEEKQDARDAAWNKMQATAIDLSAGGETLAGKQNLPEVGGETAFQQKRETTVPVDAVIEHTTEALCYLAVAMWGLFKIYRAWRPKAPKSATKVV